MGVPNGGCDDGKTSLHVDWDENSVNYTCFNPTTPFIPDENVESLLHCDNVPNNFLPSKAQNISTIFFQIELPRDAMIVGRNRGHVTSRAKRVKYKAEVEAILSLSRGVIHLKEHS